MLLTEGLTAAYDEQVVLHDLDFDVSAGELLCVLGPSGGGKSTLLRVIAGLEEPRAGRVELDGRDLAGVRALPPSRCGSERGFRAAHAGARGCRRQRSRRRAA